MTYSVRTRQTENVAGLDPTVYALQDGAGSIAEVWPALGFNCIRWTAVRDGQSHDLLYSDPALFQGASPTRSGIPVLFPFPNRIRDGRFSFAGKEYPLPLNDSARKNAIHGFACRTSWRVVDHGSDSDSAWVSGEFQCSVDAPESLPLWPADHRIRLTVHLWRGGLHLSIVVGNPDTKPLPWGLGFHPYFRTTEDSTVEVRAKKYWELEDNLPTGERRAVDEKRDLNTPRRVGNLILDDILTDLHGDFRRGDGLLERAAISVGSGATLRMFCSAHFRHLVVFTPPHRHAFCVEPYTCTTDAANRGDGDWHVLAPGDLVQLRVQLEV